MKYLFSGGGTGGPVTPLLALAEEIKKQDQDAEFGFVGSSKTDLSKELAESANIPYYCVSSGKLRRYFDVKNLVAPFQILRGVFDSLMLLRALKPNALISAGGFVSVPISLAGFLFRIPIFIHQQDARTSLTNRIIAPFATAITVTFVKSIKHFPRNKTTYMGNLVRPSMISGSKERGRDTFNLKPEKPTILVLGGGTGAAEINLLIQKSLSKLLQEAQILHVAGRGKNMIQDKKFLHAHRPPEIQRLQHENSGEQSIMHDYHLYEFLTDEMPDALAAADVVITRAGMATLTELCALEKPTILIPLPNSHQEENAMQFQKNDAAIVLSQKTITQEILINAIHSILKNPKKKQYYQKRIKNIIPSDGVAEKLAKKIVQYLHKKYEKNNISRV